MRTRHVVNKGRSCVCDGWDGGVCGCYDNVVHDDLKVWRERGGIEWAELNAAKQYGVHYQIVNHTLRRQQDCLFSAR